MTLLQTVTSADRALQRAYDSSLDAIQVVEQDTGAGNEITDSFTAAGFSATSGSAADGTAVASDYAVDCSGTAKDKQVFVTVRGDANSLCKLYMEAAMDPPTGQDFTWYVVDDATAALKAKYLVGSSTAGQAIGAATYVLAIPVSVICDQLRLKVIAGSSSGTAHIYIDTADIKMRTVA